MKLKKGINNPLIYASVLLSYFCAGFGNFNPFPVKKLNGVWQYKAIYKNKTSVLTPEEGDTMLLDIKNSRFHYKIKTLNKDIGGIFRIKTVPLDSSPYKRALEFQYPNNNKRIFNIMLLTDSLVIREGNTTFHYLRKKQ